mmetsp:Transcript_1144/g.2700  ORF Transcript_1144/g.2700 Transcript_1144/m.2700 type:complete len:381 (-) Transcript_1144:871-2013(-)
MSRCLAFLLALLAVSDPRRDRFADGFLMVSGATASIATPSPEVRNFATRHSEARRRSNGRGVGITRRKIAAHDRNGRTRLSQTRTPPTEQQQGPPAPETTKPKKLNAAKFAVTEGPDLASKPDYENIHGPLGKTVDDVFMYVFRSKLAEHVGVDSKLPKTDFSGLMELTVAMNARYSDRREIHKIAQRTLQSLFPSWLPGSFAILFARPFPEFSSRMNAWATWVAGQWLMGECEINDIEIDGKTFKDQGVLVKRCRFLEESGCASVCVNSCKIPTQRFFIENMGLPLTMTPDYETHECQFSFGRPSTDQDDLDAMGTPCLSRCPTAGSMRKWHNGGSAARAKATNDEDAASFPLEPPPEIGSQCAFMENQPGDENQQLQP